MTRTLNEKRANPGCFKLCVWEQEGTEGQIEWRGTLRDLQTGCVFSFDDWPDMLEVISEALLQKRIAPQPKQALVS